MVPLGLVAGLVWVGIARYPTDIGIAILDGLHREDLGEASKTMEKHDIDIKLDFDRLRTYYYPIFIHRAQNRNRV